ncbi:MAG: cobalamin B12-binding domain-containing protein, partial [Acetatifactor sp.]|nr:cobalamin B12-binding domain-containing protein [Acetatifactor sp.]
MKILLIAINAKYIHSNPAVYSLKSCVGVYKSCVDIAEFTINQQPAFILREIYKKKPDVIAFSCYIWNRSVMDAIIPDLHKLLPQVDIWAGRPEVSYDAAETVHRWRLRGVMTGPGEAVFSRLAAAYAAGTAQELPAVLDGGKMPRLKLDDIPFWYEDMQDFEHRIVYYESSRGCPFSCSYC